MLIAGIPARLLQSERALTRGYWRDLADGFVVTLRSRSMVAVLVAWGIASFGLGAANVSQIFLAKGTFSSGSFGYGLLYGAIGAGLVVGAFFSAQVLERLGVGGTYGLGLAVMGLGLVGAAVSPNVWVAAGCCVVLGVGNGTAVACNALLVQRGTFDVMRGRALTFVMSATYLAVAIGELVGGSFVHAGVAPDVPRWLWGTAGLALGVAALAGWAIARKLGGRDGRGRRARSGRCRYRQLESPAVAGRRDWTREDLAAGVRSGDRRALARAISLVEDGDPLAYGVVADVYPATGSAYSVGITGPPGVGKSSLASALIRHVRAQEQTVGVISVDPSSPFTHGALLGDRIRLTDHFLDPGVFIRSMGTRGHLGGLAEATLQALLLLDAAGKDIVLLETVGAGQSEVEVIGIADTVLLVLMPGSGDAVQALKAGIMEIPDVIAINKMDSPAAKTMLNEVRSILALGHGSEWKPPIVLTEAVRGENIAELWEKIEAAPRVPRARAGSSRSGAARISRARCSRSRRAAPAGISSGRWQTIPSCGGCSPRFRRASSTRSPPCERYSRRSSASTMATVTAPGLPEIERAREVIAGVARVTPVYPTETFSRLVGRPVLTKVECLQRTGSFKVRGAFTKLSSLAPEARAAGVVAASAGNHGQAVAWAARELGAPARVFMPQDSPMAKVDATRNYGAEVELGGDAIEDSIEAAMAYVEETGGTFIHPFEDPVIIAGQGTIGLEIAEQVDELETVIIPIGGGGLASGISLALRAVRPGLRIIGVQAAGTRPGGHAASRSPTASR